MIREINDPMELDPPFEQVVRVAYEETSQREQLIAQAEEFVKNLKKIHQKFSETELRNQLLEGDLYQAEEDLSDAQDRVERTKRKLETVQLENEYFREELSEKNQNEKQLIYNVAELHECVAVESMSKMQLEACIAELEAEKEKLEDQYHTLENDYEGLSAITNLKIDELNGDLQTFQEHNQELMADNEELRCEVKRLKAEIQAGNDEHYASMAELNRRWEADQVRLEQMADLERLYQASQDENAKLRDEADVQEDELEQLRANLEQLQQFMIDHSSEPPSAALQAELNALKRRYEMLMTVLRQKLGPVITKENGEAALDHYWHHFAREEAEKRCNQAKGEVEQARRVNDQLRAEVERMQQEMCPRSELRKSREMCSAQALEITRLQEELRKAQRQAAREKREREAAQSQPLLLENHFEAPWERSPTY